MTDAKTSLVKQIANAMGKRIQSARFAAKAETRDTNNSRNPFETPRVKAKNNPLIKTPAAFSAVRQILERRAKGRAKRISRKILTNSSLFPHKI